VRWARTLSTVLLLAGGSLMLFPLLRIAYTTFLVGPIQEAALAAWEQQAPSAAERGQAAGRRTPEGLILTIPRLGLRRFIPEGANLAQLRRYGAGRITWTALPDRTGIVAIAGHRSTYGAPFYRLNKLERGDLVLIDYAGKRFSYIVTDQRVLKPERSEVLQGPPGHRGVALVTCTPVYSAAYRLVVLGKLSEISEISSRP